MANDMQRRIIVAAIGIPVVVVALLFPLFTAVIIGVLSFVGLQEFTAMRELLVNQLAQGDRHSEHKQLPVPPLLTSVENYIRCGLATSLVLWAYYSDVHACGPLIVGMFAVCFTILAWSMLTGGRLAFESGYTPSAKSFCEAALDCFGILYIVVPLCLGLILAKSSFPVILVTLSSNWCSDAAALFAGKRFGKTKLYSPISPNKTLEGFFAAITAPAVLAVVLYGIISIFMTVKHGVVFFALLGFLVGLFGVVGDLCESYLKRVANVKDSGDFFGAHGGVLDRIDGIFFAIPVAYFLFHYLV